MYAVVLLSIAIHSCYLGSKVVVSLFALELGASQFTVGVLAAFYAIVPLLLGVYSGRLADRRGMRLPMLVGASCMVVAMLCGFLLRELTGLFVVSILVGAAFVFFNVSVQNLAGGIGSPEHRARNFSILAIGYSVSAFIGPMFAGFSIDHNGYAKTFLYFVFFALVPVVVLAVRPRLVHVTAAAHAEEKSTLELLRDAPLRNLIITSGLCVASAELFAFYVPVFSHSIGLSASTIGLILGASAAAVFVTRFLLPAMLRRWRPDQIMSSMMLIAALAFAIFPLMRSVYPLIAMAVVIGFGVGCAQPLLMALSYEKSPPGRTGEVTGLRLTANNVARVTIPLISGALGALLGAAPVFWLNAANLAAISWLSRR
ncbi:MAG TPA: MFS transporter [Burkholderiales bacterium]|nr:MFS transporter [Burkholderiales bacterium]